MPHEINRILAACAATAWAIDPGKAMEIANVLSLRVAGQPRAWDGEHVAGPLHQQVDARRGPIHVIALQGTILPKSNMMTEFSGGASLEAFTRVFDQAAADETASAIVLDIDSPGGVTSMVEETAARIFAARRDNRPIIAVANTMAASAAYWIASACDRIVAPPSANVGSIGVYTWHDDMSKMMAEAGVDRTVVFEGPRKVENLPFAALTDSARQALQESVRSTYRAFTSDVARFRGVSANVVRADPEGNSDHYGGGRSYHAREARRLGMIDQVATLDQVIADLQRGRSPRRRPSSRASLRAARLRLT